MRAPPSTERVAPARWRRVLPWAVFIAIMIALDASHVSELPWIRAGKKPWWFYHSVLTGFNRAFWVYFAFRLTRRFPIGRSQPRLHWGVHALGAAIFGVGSTLVDRAIDLPSFAPGKSPYPVWFSMLSDAAFYPVLAGIAHGIEYVRRHRASQAAGAQLESELGDVQRRRAEAELRALKAELNPHLLASALSGVSALVRSDPAAAVRALADLGDLMRSAISPFNAHEVTLGEEIDSLEPFLAVERARFGNAFAIEWDVPESVRQALVPRMILQLLIESAVKHGYAPRRAESVSVTAAGGSDGDAELRLAVACARTHVASPETMSRHADAQLAHAQTRLRELYGSQILLELETSVEDGAVVRLTLPWREDGRPPRVESVADHELAPPEKASGRIRAVLALWFLVFGTLSFVMMRGRFPLHGVILVSFLEAAMTTSAIYVSFRITRGTELSATWRSHGVAAACFAVATMLLRNVPYWLIGRPYSAHSVVGNLAEMIRGVVIYGVVAGIVHGAEYARRFRRTEGRGMVLRDELTTMGRRRTEAELRALKAELNPHFLGNALGAVSSLVRPDPAAAERVLAELRDVLQSAISQLDVQEVTLGEEIRGLAPFLAVERARFGERLVVSWDVDAEAMDARVPHMLLQPLVENAMKHGLSPRGGPGQIVVSGHRAGQRLELSVRDNGVGMGETGAANARQGGIGLANARSRLQELYGPGASLDLVAAPEGGTVAQVTLPWH